MSNLINDRVAYFLRKFPPFDALDRKDLLHTAEQITVKYLPAKTFLFHEGAGGSGYCYILNQGNIKLLKKEAGGSKLIDQCEPGDIFGVRSILTQKPYSLSAQAIEESLVYAIPKSVFEQLIQENPSFAAFFTNGYAAGQVIVRSDQEYRSLENSLAVPGIDYSKQVLVCSDISISEAAREMKKKGVGSIIIVNDKAFPMGIVTDTDLRNKVLAEEVNPSTSIREIMSSPVTTIEPSFSLAEVLMEMVRTGVHHLVVTKDGTPASEVEGIVSDHDVMLAQSNHPASLIKSLKKSKDPSEWKMIREKAEKMLLELLRQEVKTSLLAALITKINDTIIEKAILKSLESHPELSGVEFTWLNLGSEGREEQLLRTDQDNAIIYPDENELQKEKILILAREVNEILIF
ncbi:MAG: DUF294 nucleotidyltransferase-like domain-containing protein, partial [Bacteroidota bacterium]